MQTELTFETRALNVHKFEDLINDTFSRDSICNFLTNTAMLCIHNKNLYSGVTFWPLISCTKFHLILYFNEFENMCYYKFDNYISCCYCQLTQQAFEITFTLFQKRLVLSEPGHCSFDSKKLYQHWLDLSM